jgi:hypothetical protein
MKQLLSIATAAFLACGLFGAQASAGDCNSCDSCGSGKKSFFSHGFFSKKSCGCDTCSTPVATTSYSNCCDDSCGKKHPFSGGFRLFGHKKDCNSCGCESTPVYTHASNDCGCDDGCGKKKHRWFGRSNDCGCDDGCGKKLSLPKINFFKRGCGCGSSSSSDCCGNGYGSYGHTTYGGTTSGGVIIQQAPSGGTLAPVPGPAQPTLRPVQPAPVPAPGGAPAPVPVPAGS